MKYNYRICKDGVGDYYWIEFYNPYAEGTQYEWSKLPIFSNYFGNFKKAEKALNEYMARQEKIVVKEYA